MFRTLVVMVVCLNLAIVDAACGDEKPITNEIALTAKKQYEEAIENAKKAYVEQLEVAIKDAGGAGNLEEASRIEAEKKRIEGNDPVTIFRRRLIGTKWHTDPNNPKSWNLFKEDNEVVTFEGVRYAWYVTTEDTIIYQHPTNLNIWVWHFNEKLDRAVLHQFKKSGKVVQGKKIR